jgi:hypothetical protein
MMYFAFLGEEATPLKGKVVVVVVVLLWKDPEFGICYATALHDDVMWVYKANYCSL